MHKYDYQNQERQDELGLNWLQFKYRMQDPALGRFVSIDPLAADYTHNSPFAFAENKVIKYNELEGLEITLNKFDKLSRDNQQGFNGHATFLANAAIGAANAAIGAFNYAGTLTDPNAPLSGLGFGANKLASDAGAVVKGIAHYATSTSLSEFGSDVAKVAADPNTSEDLFGGFMIGAILSKVGKFGSISKSTNAVDEIVSSGKAGSSGGPGAGKAFSNKTKNLTEQQANGTCEYCGVKTTREPGPTQRNTDHIDPKSRGGNNTIDNADNTCRTCNQQKGTRTKQEFRRDLSKDERLRSNGN